MAKSIANGIIEATINPERTSPKKTTSTKMTMSVPSRIFFSRVLMALATNSHLSKKWLYNHH